MKHVAIFSPNIEEIDLGFSIVSSEGVTYLCKNENGETLCTKLKKLCLEYTVIKEDDVKYLLQNLPSLEIIKYFDLPDVLYSLHKHDLPSLANVQPYNIVALDLHSHLNDSSSYVDIIKICLSLCPHLKSLNWSLKNNEVNFFPKLPDLERLHIDNYSASTINIDKYLKGLCVKLTSLTVIDCTVSLSALSESCPRIKELCLNNVHFLVDDDDSKPRFNSLTSLTFKNSNVSKNIKAICLLLTSSEKMESFTFSGCNLLLSEIKAHILKCCEVNPVNKISFYSSRIDKEYIKDLLLSCQSLRCLNIDYCLKNYKDELLTFAEILPNKPEIKIRKGCDPEADFFDFDDDFDSFFL